MIYNQIETWLAFAILAMFLVFVFVSRNSFPYKYLGVITVSPKIPLSCSQGEMMGSAGEAIREVFYYKIKNQTN